MHIQPLAILIGVLAATCLGACRSVAWVEDDSVEAIEWRGRRVWVGAEDTVLATSEDAAAEAAAFLEDVRPALAEAGVDAGRGLVIAMGPDDAHLFASEGAGDYGMRELARRHRQVLAEAGAEAAAARILFDQDDEDLDPEDIDELMQALARTVPAAVPLRDVELALPSALTSRADWVFVFPTRSSLYRAASTVLQTALADASFGERLLIAPFLGTAKSRAVAEMANVRARHLGEVLLARNGHATRGTETARACYEALGLLDTEMALPLVDPETGDVVPLEAPLDGR